jgi:hypothetical protein
MTARENLDLLDWSARRDIIRLMVRRIEIDEGQVEIVFRIPPPPSGGTGADPKFKSKHHCTGERGAHPGVAQPQPAALERSGGDAHFSPRLPLGRFRHAPRPPLGTPLMIRGRTLRQEGS